jgi:uncharacterized membrane protein
MCHGAAGADEERAPRHARIVEAARRLVYQQAVVAKLMPMNNATGITDAERAVIGQWFQAGAKVD